MITSVNIRPDVGMLCNMRYMNYEQSFALAEFVDNSIQSFLDNEEEIKSIDGEDAKLRIRIIYDNNRLIISDNAGGIAEENYPRAFTAGVRPQNSDGLSEFGMGMKASACWYANNWSVVTTALDEPFTRTVSCDITEIEKNNTENLDVESVDADPDEHGTTITLSNLHQRPWGAGYTKIQEYLESIYRLFLQGGQVEIYCLNRLLSAPKRPDILCAPHHKDLAGDPQEWEKSIEFEFQGVRVNGLAALRFPGLTSGVGFSLFRRNRLIVEKYLPYKIFGLPNSGASQRMFGELHLEGVGVSFAKDTFNWDENTENIFMEKLKKECELLIDQANNYPYRQHDPSTSRPKLPSDPDPIPVPDPTPVPDPIPVPDPTPVPDPEPEAFVIDHTVRVDFQGEVWKIDLATPLIYFMELPEGNVIKIGKTDTVRGLTQRRSSAQTYFVENVSFLGVIPFDVGHDLGPDEDALLEQFGRANTTRNGCELVHDNDEVREYIRENCAPAEPYLRAIRSS